MEGGTLRTGAGGDILQLALNEDSHHIRGGMDGVGGGEIPADWQTWEKRTRNAEIYRRYLAGGNYSDVLTEVVNPDILPNNGTGAFDPERQPLPFFGMDPSSERSHISHTINQFIVSQRQ